MVIVTGWPYCMAAKGAGPGEVVVGVGPVLGIGPAGRPLPLLLIGWAMPS